jgi:hypothetical protein
MMFRGDALKFLLPKVLTVAAKFGFGFLPELKVRIKTRRIAHVANVYRQTAINFLVIMNIFKTLNSFPNILLEIPCFSFIVIIMIKGGIDALKESTPKRHHRLTHRFERPHQKNTVYLHQHMSMNFAFRTTILGCQSAASHFNHLHVK